MGSEARARVSLVALLVLTLFTFGQVFDGGDYVGPAMLAIGAATTIAVLARRAGWGAWLATVVSLVAMLLYLIIVFAPHQTIYGLPTIEAAQRLWRAVDRAILMSETDYAPVPVRIGYVILIVAGMWLAATFAEVAAFRWKRPLLATLLPITMFCLVMVVGTQDAASFSVSLFLGVLLTFWALEASHRLRSWGRGISAWSHRGAEEIEAPAVTNSLARRMGVATVAVAIVSPLILPAFGDGLLAWRTQIGEGPGGGSGGGGGGEINPLVSIAPRLIKQSDEILFRVGSERPAYWRVGSLAIFDGTDWKRSTKHPSELRLPVVPDSAPVREVQQRFTLTKLEGSRLPAAVQATQDIDFRTSEPRFDEGALRVDAEGALELYESFGDDPKPQNINGLSYDIVSVLPSVSYEQLREARPAIPGPEYADVPPDLSEEVRDLVRGWTAGAETPVDSLIAIQDQLRAFTHSLDVEPSASTDHLTRFLLETKTGYCQQFATAFAILARFQGFATRVSYGFLPGEQDPGQEDVFIVRGTHAHAWPEVYFDGIGWVAFEPTPRSQTTPPGYTIPGSDFVGTLGADGGFAASGGGTTTAGDIRGNLGDLGGTRGGACPQGTLGGACAGPRDPGATVDFPTANPGPQGTTVWEKAFDRLAIVILVLVVLFLIAMPLVKRWLTTQRYRRAQDARSTAAAAFADFESNAGELASPRSPSESPTSYATRLATMARVPKRAATRLATLYEQAAYSREGVSRGQAEEARRLATDLRGRLWSTSSWWERAQRLFSPRGLRTG